MPNGDQQETEIGDGVVIGDACSMVIACNCGGGGVIGVAMSIVGCVCFGDMMF